MCQTTRNYEGRYYNDTMTRYPWDTQGNYGHKKSYDETTGGQECTHSSGITSKDVLFVNSTRSTVTRQTQLYNLSNLNTPALSPSSPWFITNLPLSEGFDSIMVMVDHGSTKGVILEPCNKTIDATGTATILLNSVY